VTLSSLIEPAQQLAGTDVLVVKGRFEVSGLSTGIFRPDKDGEGGMDLRTMVHGTNMSSFFN